MRVLSFPLGQAPLCVSRIWADLLRTICAKVAFGDTVGAVDPTGFAIMPPFGFTRHSLTGQQGYESTAYDDVSSGTEQRIWATCSSVAAPFPCSVFFFFFLPNEADEAEKLVAQLISTGLLGRNESSQAYHHPVDGGCNLRRNIGEGCCSCRAIKSCSPEIIPGRNLSSCSNPLDSLCSSCHEQHGMVKKAKAPETPLHAIILSGRLFPSEFFDVKVSPPQT